MKKLFLALCMTAALSACGPSNTPVLDQNGQPTGQSVQGMGAGTGALLGGLAGYMLGRSSANSAGVCSTIYYGDPTKDSHHRQATCSTCSCTNG